MNNRMYISGKITGDPEYKVKFKLAEAEIRNARRKCSDKTLCKSCLFHDNRYIYGCVVKDLIVYHQAIEPVNPAEFGVDGKGWWTCMLYCVMKLVRCSYVYMLKDWKESRGARYEHKIARFLRKKILYQ